MGKSYDYISEYDTILKCTGNKVPKGDTKLKNFEKYQKTAKTEKFPLIEKNVKIIKLTISLIGCRFMQNLKQIGNRNFKDILVIQFFIQMNF